MFLVQNENMKFTEGVFFSIAAILIVFLVLTILVLIVSLMSKFKFKESKKEEKTAPVTVAPQKKLSVEDIKDEDMMVAALVATIDFIEETKKTDARVVSIKQIG